MKIETGEPRETGHYVCWLPGVGFPTVVRFWLAGGHGWLNNLKEPVAGDVAVLVDPKHSRDKYGRVLGIMMAGETNINATLLAEGLGKPYDGGKR
jgi:hypothetical protein